MFYSIVGITCGFYIKKYGYQKLIINQLNVLNSIIFVTNLILTALFIILDALLLQTGLIQGITYIFSGIISIVSFLTIFVDGDCNNNYQQII